MKKANVSPRYELRHGLNFGNCVVGKYTNKKEVLECTKQ